MTALATLADFVQLGLPQGALVPPPRPVESVDVADGALVARGHGLLAGDVVKLEGAGLPSPLVAGSLYAAAPLDLDTFQLRYLSGPDAGQLVAIASAGVQPLDFRADPRPMITRALEAASATVQDKAMAHGTITVPTHEVVEVVCVLAAGTIMHANRLRLPLNEMQQKQLEQRLTYAHARLKAWEDGKPIAGVQDATPTFAEAGAQASLITGAPQGGGWGWGCGGL